MTVVGSARSFQKKFLFTVEIAGVAWAGFQKCGEIKMTTALVYQYEQMGDLPVANGSPGRIKTADVVLERGASEDLDLWHWYLQVNRAAAGTGAVEARYKRTANVVRRDRDGIVLRRWELRNAWPTEYSAGDSDGTADANVIESVTLAYDYFEADDDPAP
jgi:phage tail-like protein